ncbi:MAG: hypothetical protein JSS07_12415 [Proteobacteria bacterium]|nr:hypothetical protein [Pseudomonadota bacterium]
MTSNNPAINKANIDEVIEEITTSFKKIVIKDMLTESLMELEGGNYLGLQEILKYFKDRNLDLYNRLDKVDFSILGQAISGLVSPVLSLRHNFITTSKLNQLIPFFENMEVEKLFLDINHIDSEGGISLAKILKLTKFKALSLSLNELGSGCAKMLGQGVRDSVIDSLCLRYNNLGFFGAIELMKALSGPTKSSLLNLDLGGNKLGSFGLYRLGQWVNKTQIRTLDLSDNNLGTQGFLELLQGLNGNTLLEKLIVTENNIGNDSAPKIVSALKNIKNLKVLNLAANKIGDTLSIELARHLNEFNNLKELYLGSNKIRDLGACALAKKSHESNLKLLALGKNIIGDLGAQELAKSLKFNKISDLDIHDNLKLSEQTLQLFIDNISGSMLTILSFSGKSEKLKLAIKLNHMKLRLEPYYVAKCLVDCIQNESQHLHLVKDVATIILNYLPSMVTQSRPFFSAQRYLEIAENQLVKQKNATIKKNV